MIRRRRKVLFTVVCIVFVLCFVLHSPYRVVILIRDVGYLTRPIWDKPGQRPEIQIPHFHADTLPQAILCSLHQWTNREELEIPKVIDAVIFSIELDILEIRMKELWDVVDKFVVVEADTTFHGQPKPLYLKEQLLDRFAWAKEKLVYFVISDLKSLPKGEKPFYNEGKMRRHVTSLIKSDNVAVKHGDLIIVADVDEIPSKETISLLKYCKGYPSGLHLQMKSYLYSFEFFVDRDNWKPHIAVYDSGNFFYHHANKASDYLLTDAGWHCTFCFRHLSDFLFKMTSYSHNDRVTSKALLNKKNIQQKICSGSDIFDMYPEAYSYKQLFAMMGNVPKINSAIDIPNYVVENSEKFKFLLPGGCQREE